MNGPRANPKDRLATYIAIVSPGHAEELGQSKSKPSAQAALLIKLVQRFPDMVEHLNAV